MGSRGGFDFEAAFGGGVSNGVEAAVGDGGGGGETEAGEGREVRGADGLPEVVGGHGNGP